MRLFFLLIGKQPLSRGIVFLSEKEGRKGAATRACRRLSLGGKAENEEIVDGGFLVECANAPCDNGRKELPLQ